MSSSPVRIKKYLQQRWVNSLGSRQIPPGTTLSGSTNNTVATVTGANALIGDANLTFDGTRLGVNNTSPSTVDGNTDVIVVGDGNANADIIMYSPTGGNSVLGFTDTADTTNQGFIQYQHGSDNALKFGTSATERMRIDSAGKMGIGIAAPSTALNVVAGSAKFRVAHTGNAYATELGCFGLLNIIDDTDSNHFRVAFDGTERMRVTAAGLVGIGTASPGFPLHVVGNVSGDPLWVARIQNSASSSVNGMQIYFSAADPDNNAQEFFRCQGNGGVVRMRIYSDGDVNTHDAGTLTSDERLKTNIVDASDKLADVMRLAVRNYEWTPEFHPNKVGEKKIGFIAQELETVFPSLVSDHDIATDNSIEEELYDEEDIIPEGAVIGDVKVAAKDHEPVIRKAYKDAFAPILVKSLQEVTTRLEAAEAKITALESA